MRDTVILFLRVGWSAGLLFLSGAGLRKARGGASGTAPMISSLGYPFDQAPEVFAGAAMCAELVIPFFIMFGLHTRFAALYGLVHFGVATWAHLVPWNQPFKNVLVSPTDPSGIGSLFWMAVCVLIFWLGPGHYSLDARISGTDSMESSDKAKSD